MKTSTRVPGRADTHDEHREAEPDLSDIPEVSFHQAVRNPYLILLDPDVWAVFPTAEAANAALRAYAKEHGLDREPRPTHGEVLRRLAAERRAACGQ